MKVIDTKFGNMANNVVLEDLIKHIEKQDKIIRNLAERVDYLENMNFKNFDRNNQLNYNGYREN